MLNLAFILFGYLILGAWIAYVTDRAQMGKEVPYGEFPALLPLPILRRVLAFWMIVFGPAACVYYLPWKHFFRLITRRHRHHA